MKIRHLFFLLAVLIISLSVVSADTNLTDDAANLEIHEKIDNNPVEIADGNSIEKIDVSKNIKENQVTTQLTSSNYNQYFRHDSSTNQTATTGLILSGDTINLEGNFQNVNFTLDKENLTLTSINKNAKLINCTVAITAKNCRVSNLNINNTNSYGLGIFVNNTSNAMVVNNTVFVQNLYAYGIVCDRMINSTVESNNITSKRVDNAPLFSNYKQCALVLTASHFNKILNNRVNCTFANGIYLSVYGSVFMEGGYSDNNLIEGNYVLGGDTVWCYTIQVMGSNNIVRRNTVLGGHRGVSCEGNKNNTIIENNIQAVMQAVHTSSLCRVLNNNITVNESAVGIYTGEADALIENNRINSINSPAIKIASSNINISNNIIISSNSYGIYSKGAHKNINIINNNITSQETGILFEKQSKTKRVNNILVHNNKINSKSTYAIDFSQAGSLQEDEIHVNVTKNNVLLSVKGGGLSNAYLPPTALSGSVVVEKGINATVTMSNYHTYFNAEGISKPVITPNSNITLKGVFNDVDFQFTNQVNVVGQNCIINMGSIILSEDASLSSLRNIRINNTKKTNNVNRHAIELIEVNNCNITNITIDNYDLAESIGILIYSSSGNTISNNNISTSGNYVNNGIFIYTSDINTIKNNTVLINQGNNPYEDYGEIMFSERLGTIKNIQHEHAIVMIYSSSNAIDHNIISSKSQFKSYIRPSEELQNSLTGIKIYYDSHSNNVTYNQVYLDSYAPYTIGMSVVGAPTSSTLLRLNSSNNLFRKNTVKVLGGYSTTGFIAGTNSVDTTVNQNTLTITPRRSAKYYADYGYGLVLNSTTRLNFTNNNVTSKASSTYNVLLDHSNYNKICENIFKVKGTKPYGVASTLSTHNTIRENIFDITMKNYGTTTPIDEQVIDSGDYGVYLSKKSHNNSITANTIKTNALWAVMVGEDCVQNNITNNSLQSNKTFGDRAVKNESKALIQNNYLYPIKCSAKNVDGIVGSNITLIAYMSSRTKDLSNVTATFRLGDVVVGKSKITDGKVSVVYQIPSYWRAANYDIIVVMGGTNFQNSTARATATITKNATKTVITANKVLGTPGSTVQMNATVMDIYGNNMNGKVDFILNGTKVATKTLTDGKATYSHKIPSNSPITTMPLVIKYHGNDQFAPSELSTILGIQNKVTATVYYSNATIGSPIVFKAKFTQKGKALTAGKVAVKINGLTIGTCNIVNGMATYNYVVPVGYSVFQKHVVQFVYGGTDTLTSARAERAFDVYPMKTVIQLNRTTAKVGQNITMKVRITNESLTHNAISGKVALKIRGVTVKDANGNPIVAVPQKGIVNIKIPVTRSLIGSNTITVTYSGNNRLTGARVDFKDILVVTS